MAKEKVIVVDARGAFCPGPLMELMKASKEATSGTVFHLLTNEEGSKKDVPAWVKKMGHDYLGEEADEGSAFRLKVRIK